MRPTFIRVFRFQTTATTNSGFLGTALSTAGTSLVVIARRYPASVVPVDQSLIQADAGLTEIANFHLICPWMRRQDGTLIVQARDWLTDLKTGSQYQVLSSYDPFDSQLEIHAKLFFGNQPPTPLVAS